MSSQDFREKKRTIWKTDLKRGVDVGLVKYELWELPSKNRKVKAKKKAR